MKKLLFILLLTFSIPFAQNCKPFDDERKDQFQEYIWNNSHDMVLINRGLDCDYGYYWEGLYKTLFDIPMCSSFLLKENKQIILLNIDKYSLKTTVYFDEYDMIIKKETDKSVMTCVDLYKNFKLKK